MVALCITSFWGWTWIAIVLAGAFGWFGCMGYLTGDWDRRRKVARKRPYDWQKEA